MAKQVLKGDLQLLFRKMNSHNKHIFNQEHWFWQMGVFAALMNLIKCQKKINLVYMKLWNSKLFLFLSAVFKLN
jgi:hypothetical protein